MAKKQQYQREYIIKSSTRVLFNFLGTPSGLSEWFADDLHIKNEIFTFYWDGSEDQARLISKKPGESIRFQWTSDDGEDYFFEFRIQIDQLTKEVALLITDFAEPDEVEESQHLWDSQVNNLMHKLGS